MSLTKKTQEQRGKPSGLFGTIIGKFMNIFHGNIHEWGLQNCSFNENYICLDIGCGGDNAVKAIAEKVTKGKVSYQYGNLRAEEERMDYLEFILAAFKLETIKTYTIRRKQSFFLLLFFQF